MTGHRSWRALLAAAALALAFGSSASARADSPAARTGWCSAALEELTPGVCFHTPERAASDQSPRTLVIFLHSLIGAKDGAAWPLQERMLAHAKRYGFTMLVPRGRPGFGPGRASDVLAWPTAQALQDAHEAELLAQWHAARTEAERRVGKFDKVLVLGFSNGAYYATSLAVRGKLEVDGYGAFAGGSGRDYVRLAAARCKRRVPIFVGYGTQDPDHTSQKQLIDVLAGLGWPHRSLAARVGHTVSGDQMRAAWNYLTSQ